MHAYFFCHNVNLYITQTDITCLASEQGLKFTVEDAKCMQASVYIPSVIFDEYALKEDVIFSIDLNILVECLCMFWPASQEDTVAAQIFYKVNDIEIKK